MKIVGLLCIAILFLCSSVYAQRPDSAYLDSFFLYRMDSLHLPGLAASIVKDGEIIWTGAYGWAKIEDSIPATDTTIWNQGSISKTITAVAAMKAWEQDLFELDENINDLLPFNVVHYFYPNDTITPRNILVHNSCVEDNWSLWNSLIVFNEDSPVRLDTFMYNYFNPAGYWYNSLNFLNYPPGSHWEYSNVGTSLVGYLTEAVTGDSFPSYCQQHIFDPLGMSRTSWLYANLDTNNIAMPYTYIGSQYYPIGYPSTCIYPSSTLKSSLLDLTRFLLMFMQYGELDSVRVLDSTTVALMRTVQDTIPWSPNSYIGITWWYYQSTLSGRWVWGHIGGWFGTATSMHFCPAENSGAIVLTNREVGGFDDLGPMVKELLDWALQYGVAENTIEPAHFVKLQVVPNPFTYIADIRYQITDNRTTSSDESAILRMYDATGRLVRDFGQLLVIDGPSSVRWHGDDNDGRELPCGVYFLKLRAGDNSVTEKLLLIR